MIDKVVDLVVRDSTISEIYPSYLLISEDKFDSFVEALKQSKEEGDDK